MAWCSVKKHRDNFTLAFTLRFITVFTRSAIGLYLEPEESGSTHRSLTSKVHLDVILPTRPPVVSSLRASQSKPCYYSTVVMLNSDKGKR
jgi:hypothetical protein